MLTFNRFDEVMRCMDSLRSTLTRSDVSCWVLDNASTDGTREWLADTKSVLPFICDENSGVAGGRARLLDLRMREAPVDARIVFLDSDTEILDPHWLDVLDAALEPENVGVVGPGGSFVAPDWSRFVAGRPGEVDTVSGYLQMWKREAFDFGVKMDLSFDKFWHEDADMCLQARELGYDVLCVPVGVAHHPAHSGYGQDMTLHDANFARLKAKWQGKGLVKAEGGY